MFSSIHVGEHSSSSPSNIPLDSIDRVSEKEKKVAISTVAHGIAG